MTAPAQLATAARFDPDWRERAACQAADPADFFPEHHGLGSRTRTHRDAHATATRWCRTCPVLASCGQEADERRELGLWAGVWRTGTGGQHHRVPLLERRQGR